MIQTTILLVLLFATPSTARADGSAEIDTEDSLPASAGSTYDTFRLLSRYYQQQSTEEEVFRRHSQAVLSRDRLPAQPMHRSILAHRKRTVLRAKNDHGIDRTRTSDGDSLSVSELRLESRILDDLLEPSLAVAATSTEEASNHNQTTTRASGDGDSSTRAQYDSEKPSPVSISPWWVRINEEYGKNSYNFVPASRRAASSVVYTLNIGREKERRDLLVDRMDASNNVTNGGLIGNEEGEGMGNLNAISKNTTNDKDAVINSTNGNTMGTFNTTVHDETNGKTLNSKETIQSKTNTTTANSQQEQEYMIISGGYTDRDWKTFPVYAFPLTSSAQTGSGEWIDLSPLPNELTGEGNAESWCKSQDNVMARDRLYQEAKYLNVNITKNKNMTYDDPWVHADPCAPSGRMGHSSFVYNNYLYVFGGLIYDSEQSPTGSGLQESFRLEDVPYMYRLDLKEMFEARQVTASTNDRRDRRRSQDISLIHDLETLLEGDDALETFETLTSSESRHAVNASSRKVKGWQRIIPRVKPFPTINGAPAIAASEVLLKSINRGEMQGGLWNDKFVMYGGLRIALLDGAGPHAPSKVMKGPSYTTRGSAQISSRIIELPLGDVWAYDIKMDAFEKMTNDFGKPVNVQAAESLNKGFVDDKAENDDDDKWWSELDASMFPRPRTAHAATVVGDELVIHGGMGWNRQVDDWDGHTDWETLDDLWILNLKTFRWKRRWLFPLLESLMGWGKEFENFTSWDGPVVAAFGGYTNGIDVFSGEGVAYVFDDLLVSYPPPTEDDNFAISSLWLKANNPDKINYPEMISNRFEHVAVMSEETGSMFIWGGQFQDTSNVKGVWMMNLAGSDSRVSFKLAEDDGIYDEYQATLTALHTIVLMMMFLSMTLTFLLGLTQRYNELIMQHSNGDAALRTFEDFATQDFAGDVASSYGRVRGLHPQIISTIPEKIYCSNEINNSSVEDESKEDDCCPICLVDYEDGDTLRVLPCNHYMHKTCVDAWLINNPSCPSCRHSLRDLVDDRPLIHLRTLRSRLSTSRPSSMARMMFVPGSSRTHNSQDVGNDESSEIEMIAGFDGPVFDLRFVSSLELPDEGSDDVHQQRNVNNYNAEPISRRSGRERTSRLANLRRSVASVRRNRRAGWNGSRPLPLAEPLDEEPVISVV
eukprot:CCRYP_014402-RA/>CCRYP_014402-RA protein AED:0.13 eAED:0.13 QI:142/0.75/0.8/1/1/1/5/234/1160